MTQRSTEDHDLSPPFAFLVFLRKVEGDPGAA